jgi:hypothetical protein
MSLKRKINRKVVLTKEESQFVDNGFDILMANIENQRKAITGLLWISGLLAITTIGLLFDKLVYNFL